MPKLNDLAARAWECLLVQYPAWESHFGMRGEDDLEAAIPTPGGLSGHLVVSTDRGEQMWVRFAAPAACYLVDDDAELLRVVDALVTEKVVFVTTWKGAEWTGTTLLAKDREPEVEPGEVAQLISWSGRHDRVVASGEPGK